MKPINIPAVTSSIANSQASYGTGHAGHSATAPAGTTGFADAYAVAIGRSMSNQTASSFPAHAHGATAPAPPMQGTSSPVQSGHIPLSGHGSGNHEFQKRAVGILAYRQQLLASNIANADTPGYKATDVDVRETLGGGLSAAGGDPLQMATTAAGHIAAQSPLARPVLPLKYVVPSQASVDGNTVDMDVERAKFAENAIRYEFALERAVGHYKHMVEMLKDLK